jgi:branched-chain amino acid aminotransferase
VSAMLACVNGSLVPPERATVSVLDRGLLYGDAAFETLGVYGGRPFRLDAHLQRLAGSLVALRFAAPVDMERLAQQVLEVVRANALHQGIVRVTITRGAGPRGLATRGADKPTTIVTAHVAPLHLLELAAQGAAAVVATVPRVPAACLPAQAKHANMLNGILAHAQAESAGAYEALLLTVDGHVAEGSFSNVFFVADGRLHTPALTLGVLPGITRAAVIALARQAGVQVLEGAFELRMLRQAQEAFMTNTGAGVMPLARLGAQTWRAPGPVTRALHDAYRRLVALEAGPWWTADVPPVAA